MRDLNATLFYKAKFQIKANDPDNCDILWNLIREIRSWLISKKNRYSKVVDDDLAQWSKFKYGCKMYDLQNNDSIYAESLFYKDNFQTSWACSIVEKTPSKDGYAPREWITEIGYQTTEKGTADISYVVKYSDMAGYIGACAPTPTSNIPNVIRNLITNPDWICTIGSDKLSLYPQRLVAGDFPQFKELLYNPEREIPIVYISPQRILSNDDSVRTLVSPDDMMQCVGANALVYYSTDLSFSEEMQYINYNNYNCVGGAIRLYLPHININDESDQYRHRFLTAKYIEEKGAADILNIFRRALAQDVHFYDSMFRLQECRTLINYSKSQNYIAKIKEKSADEVSEAEQAFIEESDQRKEKERIIQELEAENQDLKSSKYSLEIHNEALKNKAQKLDYLEKSCADIKNIAEYPNTPTKIAEYFQKVYSDRIDFTEKAWQSLAECQTKNEIIWEAFFNMVTILYDLLKTNPAQAYKEFTEQTGWDCARSEGKMTRNDSKLMRQYIDEYQGQEINIEAHIKNKTKESDSKFIRIYFSYESTISSKIIVGHCGKHLENYTSRKIK